MNDTAVRQAKTRRIAGKIGLYSFLVLTGAMFLCPMLFTLLSSVKDNVEIFGSPFSLPSTWHFENYFTAWTEAHMSAYFLNSILIAMATIILLAIVSSAAAFAMARFKIKYGKSLMMFFLLGMMIPMHTVLVPVAYVIGTMNLKNNLVALVFIYVAFSLPFSILVLHRFMQGINASLEEAAIIDGANFFQIFTRVALPMSVPALSTISIFNFLSAWNNILFPLIFINDNALKPISLGLLNFNGERGSQYGPLMAAIVITVAVPLVIYLLFQEKVESGLAAGAVKE